MPESVKTRSSSGPTSGAIVWWASWAPEPSDMVISRRILRDPRRMPSEGKTVVPLSGHTGPRNHAMRGGCSVGGADRALDAGLVGRPPQALAQVDRRFPAEQVAGAADVGAALFGVV